MCEKCNMKLDTWIYVKTVTRVDSSTLYQTQVYTESKKIIHKGIPEIEIHKFNHDFLKVKLLNPQLKA